MAKYRNKMVYDAETGDMKDDKKHMSMLEDFWLPRREGGRGTEISTLPGGENLGQIDDIEYFRRKLYKSLNVPSGRLEQEQQFNLGRDISVDFIKDNHFSELKDAELLRERLGTLREIDEYAGRYYSVEWIRKNVLMQTEEDIENIIKQIGDEGMNDNPDDEV